jgi:ABC-type Fe3+/spermidine/putrescine transport system ATPase subunit
VAGSDASTVWVAIRPEKMNLHKDANTPPTAPDCPGSRNIAKGEIKEVSYLGDISIFHILLDNGRLIRVSRSNRSRWDQDEFGFGERVWVSWAGSSPIVLQN